MNGLTDREAASINQTIASIERKHMTRERDQTYFVNEDLRHDWSFQEVKTIKRLWENGFHIDDIAKKFECDPDEVFLLLFDLSRKDKKIKINIAQLLKRLN